MKKILSPIDKFFANITIFLIRIYQKTLSPDKGILSWRLKGRVCTHHPHCSEYGIQVLQRYGFRNGIGKATDRILHCTPSRMIQHDPSVYRVVFFSSAPIGVPFLHALATDKRYDLVGVVTMPDAPSGRGLQMQPNIIKQEAKTYLDEKNIQTPARLHPEKSDVGKEFTQRLTALEPDYIVVIAYGKIIPQPILDIPKVYPINVHGSLLPLYRGASPIQSVFLDNKKESGITIMEMVAELDAGPMIDKLFIPLPFHWTAYDLIEEMKKIGPQFLCDVLRKLGKKYLRPIAQDVSKATFCTKIEKEDGNIDIFAQALASIYPKYRAYILWPKLFFMCDTQHFPHHADKRIVIEKIVCDEKAFPSHADKPLIDATSGELNPAVQELIVKPEGKKAMAWKEFVAGYWG